MRGSHELLFAGLLTAGAGPADVIQWGRQLARAANTHQEQLPGVHHLQAQRHLQAPPARPLLLALRRGWVTFNFFSFFFHFRNRTQSPGTTARVGHVDFSLLYPVFYFLEVRNKMGKSKIMSPLPRAPTRMLRMLITTHMQTELSSNIWSLANNTRWHLLLEIFGWVCVLGSERVEAGCQVDCAIAGCSKWLKPALLVRLMVLVRREKRFIYMMPVQMLGPASTVTSQPLASSWQSETQVSYQPPIPFSKALEL